MSATTQFPRLPGRKRQRKAQVFADAALIRAAGNVVRLRPLSQYERYPMPFFNAEKHCTWDVRPTGDYTADCRTGRNYAVEFLRSCDGSYGWRSLLQQIVSDMIGAGASRWRDGGVRVNGIVIGFMHVLSEALYVARPKTLAMIAEALAKQDDE